MKPADIVALPLQIGSAVRHRRVFHPLGVLASGHLQRVAPTGVGVPVQSADVLGRVSKAIGSPGALPDLMGLAVQLPPREGSTTPWDLLLVSAGAGVLTRFALRPTVSWTGTTTSTLMPLRCDDGWWWLAARMTTPVEGGLSLDALTARIRDGGVSFDVEQAHGTGPFEPLATLTLDTVIPTDERHDVSFDPTRHRPPGIGLGPQWLTSLRERAYQRSRRGRHAPDEPRA